MSGPHVLVLAKSPVPGRVKTRLCPPFDYEQAAAIAEASLADTLDAVAASNAERRILALDGQPGPWLPPGFEVVPQVSGSLGDRLAAAWDYAGEPGLQIGMDTPQITADLMDRALARLTDHGIHDALLGPAEDGGWWALGMRQVTDGVFDGVAMSTSQTGVDQYGRLVELGLTVDMLPTMRDLDTVSDAREIAALAPGTRAAHVINVLLSEIATGGIR